MTESLNMVHISEVSRGKACGCVCPDCGIRLIARKGNKTAWHFAHSTLTECQGESALHLAAKQQLLLAAKMKAPIKLPHAVGTVCEYDIAHNMHYESWESEDKYFTPTSGTEEASLGGGVITDVLLESDSCETLSVEVFVTHRKSIEDKQKYRALGIDAIEIDLSGLPWNSDRETILDAILKTADREWVFSSKLEDMEAASRERLGAIIESVNLNLHSELLALAEASPLFSLEKLGTISWPEIRGVAKGEDAFGHDVYIRHSEHPAITHTEPTLKSKGYCWTTVGIVNSKVEIDVLFHPVGISISNYLSDRPTMAVGCFFANGDYSCWDEDSNLKWWNVEAWEKKANELAADRLNEALTQSEQKKNSLESYAKTFRTQSDLEKLQILSKSLKVSPPSYAGSAHHGWNTTWSIWKTLVWKYKIKKYRGMRLNVQHTASDDWLKLMTGFSEDEKSEEQRSKSLWFWFRELEDAGIMSHIGRQWFQISKSLPDNFKPWEKIPR